MQFKPTNRVTQQLEHTNDKPKRLEHLGGQHSAPQGTSTRDDERVALYWFELERQAYANTADVAW